jgi:hypothetical protein
MNYKQKSGNALKFLFLISLIVAILEAGWIYRSSDLTNVVSLPPYSFYDSKDDFFGVVGASGSWISTTKLANPIQTVEIECRKEDGYCRIMDSSLSGEKYLSVGSTVEKIARWTDDVIETVPSPTAFGCVEYFYRLDRRSEVVTSTRKTVDNETGLCKGIQEEPIVMHLGDGLERLQK